jgi:hypothetical protein
MQFKLHQNKVPAGKLLHASCQDTTTTTKGYLMATATAKLRHSPANVNSSPTPQAPVAAPNLLAARAAVFAAVNKRVSEVFQRDDIPDSASFGTFDVCIAAKIDGQRFVDRFTSAVSTGHASTRASSSLPNVDAIVGHILNELAPAHRAAILRRLPEIYAEHNGELPDVPKSVVDETEMMLKKLRASKTQVVRGTCHVKNTSCDDANFSIFTGE